MAAVYLVYGRLTSGGHEPLIGVLGSEDAARSMEARLTGPGGPVRVSWEVFPLLSAGQERPAPLTDGTVVHLSSQGGFDGDAESTTIDPRDCDGLALNPIGLGVFADRDEAVAFSRRQLNPSLMQVRSLPVGWVDPGFGRR